jgi:hypothetical protein
VEARKPASGQTEVVLVGERLRYILPKEAPKQREFGPWDPPDPAFVGSPWKEANLRYRGMEIECFGEAYWCAQVWFIEIVLPEAIVRTMVGDPRRKDLPVALSKRKKVEWRTPRDELLAVLDKLGVTAEFAP